MSETNSDGAEVTFRDFQELIKKMYYEKDVERGIDGTFMWLMEEVGELASALREGTVEDKSEEFADVIAWLATIANVAQIDLAGAIQKKYGTGCPGCKKLVCDCPIEEKP
ncbi:MAG: MazG nucleotide pyrophosphohydrolase domain-containing protein [Pirellulaceae bacterium]